MILIFLLAVIVLLPLALWHDWMDAYEARNPTEGPTIRDIVAWIVGIAFGIWFFSNVTW